MTRCVTAHKLHHDVYFILAPEPTILMVNTKHRDLRRLQYRNTGLRIMDPNHGPNLTYLVGSEYKTITLRMLKKSVPAV